MFLHLVSLIFLVVFFLLILGFKQLGVSRSAVEAENAKRGAETES